MAKKLFLSLFFGIFAIQSFFAQTNIANELYDNYEFRNAIIYYEKAQPLPEAELRKLAECYFYLHDYDGAEKTYKQIIDKKYVKDGDYLLYGEALKNNKKYDDALVCFNKYAAAFPEDSFVYDLIKGTGYLQRKEDVEERYDIVKLPKANTKAADFYTEIYKDGFIYVSEIVEEVEGAQLQFDSTSDLSILDYGMSLRPHAKLHYYNEKTGDKIDFTTEGKFHMGAFDIDYDNNEIYFTKIDITEKWKKTKQLPKIFKAKIDLENYRIYNIQPIDIPGFGKNDAIGHPALSADKKSIYFSAQMEGGLGGFDIYASNLVDGKWSIPVNLGPEVNSPGDEYFPKIVDVYYLYFSSNGRIGYGNQDIFKNRLENSVKPTKSQILQAPFNSPADDFGYCYNKEKFYGYLTSNRFGGEGDDDVYKFTLKELTIQGIVRDIHGNPVEGAVVKLYDKDGNLVAETVTGKDGKYSFNVMPGEYELSVETPDGYVARRKVTVDENWDNSQEIDLNLENSVAIIQGIVRDKNGNPVAGALVKLLDENGVEVAQMYTDKDGKYKFYAEPNKKYTIVSTINGQSDRKDIDVGNDWDNSQMIDLNLKPTKTAQGIVYNEDGSASPYTEISIFDENGNLIQQSTTDAEGRYQFDLKDNTNYQIKAKKKGFEGVENIFTGKNWNSYKDLNIILFPVTTVAYGTIKDDEKKLPIDGVRMVLTDKVSERKFVATTDQNGKFKLKLSNERSYILKLEKSKYYPRTIEIEPHPEWGDSVDISAILNLEMQYAGYLVQNIYFELGSFKIQEISKQQLDKLVAAMKSKPDINLHIRSYADCRGSAKANEKLTENRSKAVRDYMVDAGIDKKRLTTQSMGATNFVNNCVRPDDCTEEEHALNRRSEFEFR